MFSTSSVKKFDIQEANKHLQLLHERNGELLTELDSKTGQLSKVEAQLEEVTHMKNIEVAEFSEKLSNTEARLEQQKRETEQWKMLVHERDVMISKLQARCRQLEEMESKLYDCRPSLEVLLGLIYNADGSDLDSQAAAKEKMGDTESEAGYAEPDDTDSPEAPPFIPSSDPPSVCRDQAKHITTERIQDFLMNSVVEYEKLMDVNNKPLVSTTLENNICSDLEDTNGLAKSATDSGLGSAHCRHIVEEQSPFQKQSNPIDTPELIKAGIFQHTSEFRVRDQKYPVVKL